MDDPFVATLVACLLLLPFAGFLGVWFSSQRWAGRLAVGLTGFGLLLSLRLLTHLSGPITPLAGTWLRTSSNLFEITFRVDRPSAILLVLAHFISLLVQIYSFSYLQTGENKSRYFGYLQLFLGAMTGILLAGNLLVLYGFWELVGLASYLLIGFWHTRPEAARAAKKAFLYNRVGDVGFLLGILLIYRLFGTFTFTALTHEAPTLAGLLLFMGCVGKSAQFPLIGWLPDAMEGPTPVSALLHAATMVAAGIFLLARIHPLLSADALLVITCVGTLTTLWGGYSALFQHDIKKVLAFSTVSQLGLMVAAMGTGNVGGALFHLLTHAFFKAGLFLGAGVIIHALHTQDMRRMGGLRRTMPLTFWAYALCAASLAGVPFFSGFLSKESILAGAFAWADRQESLLALGIPLLLLFSSALTALYMARQLRLIFWGQNCQEVAAFGKEPAHVPSATLIIPVVLLAALSVWFWFSINPASAHNGWAAEWLSAANLGHLVSVAEPAPAVPLWLAPASVLLIGLGGWLGFRLREPIAGSRWARISVHYGFLDDVLTWLVVLPTRRLAFWLHRADTRSVDGLVNGTGVGTVVLAHLTHALDRYGVDGVVNGAAWFAGRVGLLTRSVQGGRVQSYITIAVVGLLLIIWLVL